MLRLGTGNQRASHRSAGLVLHCKLKRKTEERRGEDRRKTVSYDLREGCGNRIDQLGSGIIFRLRFSKTHKLRGTGHLNPLCDSGNLTLCINYSPIVCSHSLWLP